MKTADGHPAWAFRQGSASVRIHLLSGDKEGDAGYFQVVAPVIILPEEGREKIYERLLALNADQLWSCAFAVRQDRVIITATRTGTQRNETVFPTYFVEALSSPAASTSRLKPSFSTAPVMTLSKQSWKRTATSSISSVSAFL